MKIGVGTCFGTFGELIQGVVNNKPFLISLPINLKSTAFFIPNKKSKEITTLSTSPKLKSREACKLILKQSQISSGGTLIIKSNIPEGKGMASSSADIIATIRAIRKSYSLPVSERMLSDIAGTIEPTDGVMYNEIVAYDYINGDLIEKLGKLPKMRLLGIDTGGFVSTTQFNCLKKNYTSEDHSLFYDAYYLVKKAIANQHLAPLFDAVTISSTINQKILPKPYFNEMKRIALKCDGGLIVAHSGTMIGILMDSVKSMREISDISKEVKRLTGKKLVKFKIE
jgi:uncharacterized protein involved in propanediol utilization